MMEMFGRSNYPKCDAVYWDKPVKDRARNAAMPFLLEKTIKKDGPSGIAKMRSVIIKWQSITRT